ncbi:MAG: endonuclease III [Candidatus Adiutrix sp.]|jgi:endonuclease-3|nr:endonuclease III [Candidatus Adiutrix sp.]
MPPLVQPGRPTAAYVRKVLAFFDACYPEAGCALKFESHFQLLAATVLSAQCTDARVNRTTPALFARYPGPACLAEADPAEVEALVRPCGFFRNKARHLIDLSRALVLEHRGEVPRTLEELVRLPGVGRKTANVVLGNAFGVPGLTVDTHLGRLSRRLGLSARREPELVEADLARVIPRPRWTLFSHQAIAHGRAVCAARRPACAACSFTACPRLL